MDGRVAFGSGLVPLGRQAEKRKELSFASPVVRNSETYKAMRCGVVIFNFASLFYLCRE